MDNNGGGEGQKWEGGGEAVDQAVVGGKVRELYLNKNIIREKKEGIKEQK